MIKSKRFALAILKHYGITGGRVEQMTRRPRLIFTYEGKQHSIVFGSRPKDNDDAADHIARAVRRAIGIKREKH